ncbi:hypothetical protein [uncultured Phenylobacterium sp.]|uniref:hypothetical protein n=1 Tax=uncultured Phenylobacterium sp. TaxID=349273 RepID=UPI0025D8AB12|nr:hypothetical protein [uncultured Phenylobacterium sp.]
MSSTSLQVTAYAPYMGERSPGFFLPLLQSDGSEGYYLQTVDEISDLISSFSRISETPDLIFSIDIPIFVDLGSRPVFVFMDHLGVVHVGTVGDIASDLREYVKNNPADVAVRLQIANLLDEPGERRSAREAVRINIEAQLGQTAGAAFYQSALRSALWNSLIKRAPSRDAAHAVIETRSSFQSSIGDDGSIAIDISALERRSIYGDDLNAIVQDIKDEFVTRDNGISNHVDGISSTDNIKDDANKLDIIGADLLHIQATISNAPRQEERISMLLEIILRDRKVGLEILNLYRPRANFESRAIEMMRQRLNFNSEGSIPDSLVVSDIVVKLFFMIFSMNRGYLLYFASIHLGQISDVRQSIRFCLSKTQSVHVESFRSEIYDILSSWD